MFQVCELKTLHYKKSKNGSFLVRNPAIRDLFFFRYCGNDLNYWREDILTLELLQIKIRKASAIQHVKICGHALRAKQQEISILHQRQATGCFRNRERSWRNFQFKSEVEKSSYHCLIQSESNAGPDQKIFRSFWP